MAKKKSKWFEDENPAPRENSAGFDNPLNTWRRGKTGWERNDTKPAKKETEPIKDGVWRTVRGRHVFIEEGKTLEQALGHKPGVENQKKIDDPNPGPEGRKVMNSNPQHSWNQKKTEEPRDYGKERREKIFKANAKKYKKDFAFRKQK